MTDKEKIGKVLRDIRISRTGYTIEEVASKFGKSSLLRYGRVEVIDNSIRFIFWKHYKITSKNRIQGDDKIAKYSGDKIECA